LSLLCNRHRQWCVKNRVNSSRHRAILFLSFVNVKHSRGKIERFYNNANMIDRYTIKLGPAVSQKELEKALSEAKSPEELQKFHKMKTRIEFIGDIEDVKKIGDALKSLCVKQ
jgi:hypothetical protein